MKHMERKIDLKTTQKLTSSSTINQQTPSPVASVILDQEPEKKNQEVHNITHNVLVSTVTEQEASSSVASDSLYQQKEALDDSLYVCAIPPPGQYYKKIAMMEVDESLFKDPVPVKHNAQKKLKISEQTRIPMEESNSVVTEKNTLWCEKLEKIPKLPSTVVEPVTKPLTNNLKVVNPNVCNFVRCELCGINCNTRDVFNKHIAGKKHQKKLKRTALEGKDVILEGSKRKVSDSLNNEGADTKRPKTDQEGRVVFW
ncbi:uncharacterized protein LOC143584639 [Bidens hawaiensis]|uniref:uncharacterized protein LOC143558505 n=1 Tax=Bidens hawaiensis TaxID=980011 RepID=UPI004049937C